MTHEESMTLTELVTATGLPAAYLAAQVRRRGGRVADNTVLLPLTEVDAILTEFPKLRVRKMRSRYRKLQVRSDGRLNPQQLEEFRALDSIFGCERLALIRSPSARPKSASREDPESPRAMYEVRPSRSGFVVPRGHPGTGRRA